MFASSVEFPTREKGLKMITSSVVGRGIVEDRVADLVGNAIEVEDLAIRN